MRQLPLGVYRSFKISSEYEVNCTHLTGQRGWSIKHRHRSMNRYAAHGRRQTRKQCLQRVSESKPQLAENRAIGIQMRIVRSDLRQGHEYSLLPYGYIQSACVQ